jgi:hypothetical protein
MTEAASKEYELVGRVLPELEITANASGLTLSSLKGFKTPRYLPYDKKGQCELCHSSDLELDYMVDSSGITIWTNRNKHPRYMAFDVIGGEFSIEGAVIAKIRRKNFTLPFKRVIHRPIKSTTTNMDVVTDTFAAAKENKKAAAENSSMMLEEGEDGVVGASSLSAVKKEEADKENNQPSL